MADVLTQLAPVVLAAAVGAVLRITRVADDGWVEVLNRVALYAAFPAVVFLALIRVPRSALASFAPIALYTTAFLLANILVIALVTVLVPMRRDRAGAVIMVAWLGNIAYLGFPIVPRLVPDSEGYLSVIVAIYIVLLYTVGLFTASVRIGRTGGMRRAMRTALTNPVFVSVVAGLAAILARVTLPSAVEDGLEIVGSGATSIVLFAIGIFVVRRFSVRPILPYLGLIAIWKLIGMPLAYLAIGRVVGISHGLSVGVLEAAMPVAMTPFALSSFIAMDRELIVAAIVVTSLLSVFSMPLIGVALGL